MFSPGDPPARPDTWRPPGTRTIAAALGALDRLFDRVYSSPCNPLYRTGTLAALCLAVALVTGVYLLFVYEIARPWESVAAIQRDALLGRWIRALHRYSSDAAVVAVALHVLRVVLQGKTWGARGLAWITGVLLAGAMFFSAVTGFVLVWDTFGQKLAVVGARMLGLLPLFPEPPERAFMGDTPPPAQFFFMNVFLHVAVPLGMALLLWLHTARLARAAWFPERRVMLAALAGLVLLAVIWPAPLPPQADLLAIPGRVATDWFYGFWLPLAEASPAAALAAFAVLGALMVAVPWLVRPARAARSAPSVVDPEACEGCQQCFQDCPFDAIRMLPGLHPERHPLRAEVQPDLCVSCGLCAGSCASLAIGPPGRTARDQLALARRLVASTADAERRPLLVACRYEGGPAGPLAADPAAVRFDVDCAGTLHPGTVAYLGRHFAATQIAACPPQNCVHREGSALAALRVVEERAPAVAGQIARLPVRLTHAGGAPSRTSQTAGLALGALLLALVALFSAWPQGADAGHAVLRLGWRLTGQVRERCRDLTPEELAARPVHMRRPRECTSEVLTYDLTAAVDGRVVSQRRVASPGLRADRPLLVEEELAIAPGERAVSVTFVPVDRDSGGRTLAFEGRVRFAPGRVVLVTQEDGQLVAR